MVVETLSVHSSRQESQVKSEHWTPSSPLPWNLAFHLNSFSNYYSSLQSISAIYHTILAHLHKKRPCMYKQIQRESEARMLVRLTPPERGMRANVLKNHL